MQHIPLIINWNLCTNMKKYQRQHVSSSIIKRSLHVCFPIHYNITKQEVFNARIWCKRLMSTFNQSQEHKNFEDTLTSDNIFLQQVDSYLALKDYEFNEIINKLIDSIFNFVINQNQTKQGMKIFWISQYVIPILS